MYYPHQNYLLWQVARMTEADFQRAAERSDWPLRVIHLILARYQIAKWLRRNRAGWQGSFTRLDAYLATAR
jgi:hypothetical protein